MVKNIVLIVLFIALYGGLTFLFMQGKNETIDRQGFGEFSENRYTCDKCSFEIELEPDWIPLDGIAIEKTYTETELHEYFGKPDSYDIIAGFTSPDLYLECVRYINRNTSSENFSNYYLQSQLDYCRENVALQGGTLGGCGFLVTQAKGNGQDMGIFYYDYTLDDEFHSEFNCFLNNGKDTIWFYGTYKSAEARNKMLELFESKITFNSSTSQSV